MQTIEYLKENILCLLFIRKKLNVIYDQDIYINLRNIIGELLDWQEEYKNESNINN